MGISLIEVLVVIAIVGLLVALLLPAVIAAREAARRSQCSSNLRQIGVAIHNYLSDAGCFPMGNVRSFSFHVALLPYVEEQSLFNCANYDWVQSTPVNETVRKTGLTLYLCPSDPVSWKPVENGLWRTNYMGNVGTGTLRGGNNGLFRNYSPVFGGHGPVSARDVVDGLSSTAAVSESLVADGTSALLRTVYNTPTRILDPDVFPAECLRTAEVAGPDQRPWYKGLPWTEGNLARTLYNHVLPPNQPTCINHGDLGAGAITPSSSHSNGVHVLYADGRVNFVSDQVDATVWNAFGSRGGHEQ